MGESVTERMATSEELLVGRYRVIGRLGAGGMASVLVAEDQRLGRRVAVKRLRSDAPDEALTRFRREAQIGASLNHPNLVSIYDAESDPESVLIVMEYVEGRSLAEILADGRIEPERALSLLREVADALDYAHAHGIVHRDVKPANVLVASDGAAKLADLGIAAAADATRITAAHTVLGTLPYLSPERLTGEVGGPPADVYALAALAHEALSGVAVDRGATPAEVVDRAATEAPPDLRDTWPAAPEGAARALQRGMATEPEERPASAGELIADLRAALAGSNARSTTTTRMPAASHRAPAPRRRWIAPLAIVLVVAVAGALVVFTLDGGDDRANPTAASDGGSSQGAGEGAADAPSTAVPAPSGADDPAEGARLNSQGFDLIGQGRHEEAVSVLRAAVAAFPAGTTDLNYAYALFNLGNALRLSGRPDEAIPVLERRLGIDNQRDVVQRELDLARAEAGG